MTRSWAFLCAAVAVCSMAVLSESATGSAVIDLNSSNFDGLVSDGDWLIEFYAPWCGHCQRLAPTYEKVAQSLLGKVNVGKVNGAEFQGLATRFGITGYPVRGSTVVPFDGPRTAEGLEYFALTSWKEETPLSYFQSPFSIVGQVKGGVVTTMFKAKDLYDYLVQQHGYSPAMALLLVLGGSLSLAGLCGLVIAFSVMRWVDSGAQKQKTQ